MRWLTSRNNFNSNLRRQLLKTEDPSLFLSEWVTALSVTSLREFNLDDNYSFFKGVFSLWLYSSISVKKVIRFLKSTSNCSINLVSIEHFENYLSLEGRSKGIYDYYYRIFGDSEAYSEISKNYVQNSIYDISYISKRDNISEDQAREVIERTKLLTKGSADKFTLKYGEEEGTRRYLDFKSKCSCSISSFKQRHPFDYLTRYDTYRSKISLSNSFTSLALKYGEKKAREICLSKGRPYAQLLAKYGEEATTAIINARQKGKAGFSKASKTSIKFFLPLYTYLIEDKGISSQDIFWGVEASSEYMIMHEGKRYYYDFTILSLKVIVEFNGHRFHPSSPSSSWVHPYNPNITALVKYQYDSFKRDLAIKSGFKVIVVFDNNPPKIKDLLNLIYEN